MPAIEDISVVLEIHSSACARVRSKRYARLCSRCASDVHAQRYGEPYATLAGIAPVVAPVFGSKVGSVTTVMLFSFPTETVTDAESLERSCRLPRNARERYSWFSRQGTRRSVHDSARSQR